MAASTERRIASGWAKATSGVTAALVAGGGLASGMVLDAAGTAGAAVACFATGIVIGGWGPGRDGVRALAQRRLDVDLLMVLAAVAAAVLGQWRDASLLIVIFATTGALEEAATARTAAGVRALLVDAPESAELVGVDGANSLVPVEDLVVGARVLARPGSRIPTDGTVVEGEAAVDESSLTGEPLPVRKVPGRTVLAGATVTEGALVVEVTKVAADSTLARLTAAVTEAIDQQPPTQLFVERFEQRYSVGVVVAAALLVAVGPLWWGWTADQTVMRTMTFLVVASPCAVVLATMPATLSALAAAARHRVLVRGGAVLERLAAVEVAAFDKTGTLTVGTPRVVAVVVAPEGATDLDADQLLGLAAAAEAWSEHPIGRAIVAAAHQRGLTVAPAVDVEMIPSRGVRATVDGVAIRVGGAALLGDLDTSEEGTVVGLEVAGALRGLIVLEDQVRDEAACTIACLVDGGVQETWLLTGDRAHTAARVATATGVDHRAHGLLPHEKAEAIGHLGIDPQRVVYVGDGVNDAAALASAGVGVSLAQAGSALAIDAADIILMDDDLHRLPDIAQLARRTQRIVRANLAFALAVIAALVTLDLAGHLPLVLGVMGHEGSSAIVALNGLRLLRWQPKPHPPRPPTPKPSEGRGEALSAPAPGAD